ncbi:MAG: type I-E CRISPR-associated protein Cse1/CasA [Candidatus Nitrosoglobus sp.]
MNILVDNWIPVLHDKSSRQISLRDLLCQEADWDLALPRDDMELAGLQLLISLTQVLFMPVDQRVLQARIKTPLREAEFEQGIANYQEWFDLDHSAMPFMQTRGVQAAEVTPIQKLFIGLPEGNNHAFFNAEGEINAVCGGCTVIALFNQANNCPSFGGGFKGSLRGSAPITTLIDVPNLRQRIWENVLPRSELPMLLPWYQEITHDQPVWVRPIQAGQKLYSYQIGLLRGLFWQPARVELRSGGGGVCDHCGAEVKQCYMGLNKEKFRYELSGVWPHPHSPRLFKLVKGKKEERYASFTTTAPAWTQLTQFLLEKADNKGGHVPAPVVSSRRQRIFSKNSRLQLLVGGYRNNQANIIDRRHELFSFSPGWEESGEQLAQLIEAGLEIKQLLRGSLYWAVKGQKDSFKGLGVKVHEPAEVRFYALSEPWVHDSLRELDFTAFQRHKSAFIARLTALASQLYEEAIYPYQHDPELIHAIAAGRSRLNKGLSQLKENQHVNAH